MLNHQFQCHLKRIFFPILEVLSTVSAKHNQNKHGQLSVLQQLRIILQPNTNDDGNITSFSKQNTHIYVGNEAFESR